MEEDETIILRVFDYSYSHAMRNATDRTGGYSIRFPEPKVIYLYAAKNIPDEYVLNLDFGKQGVFCYKVSVCKFQEISTEELNDRKKLIQNDIIKSINQNLELGNITVWDARKLRRYTHKLYEHIYSRYEEMEELNEMTDESLMLDVDIIEKKHEEELKKLKDVIADKDEILTEKNKELDQKDKELSIKDEEIERLKEMLAKAGLQE